MTSKIIQDIDTRINIYFGHRYYYLQSNNYVLVITSEDIASFSMAQIHKIKSVVEHKDREVTSVYSVGKCYYETIAMSDQDVDKLAYFLKKVAIKKPKGMQVKYTPGKGLNFEFEDIL